MAEFAYAPVLGTGLFGGGGSSPPSPTIFTGETMSRKILNRVTVTGADNSVDPEALIALAEAYPFVEWGILLSKSNEGGPRFPSLEWIEELRRLTKERLPMMKVSGHICGEWVRDICKGYWVIFTDLYNAGYPNVFNMFHRLQLNFHSYLHLIKRAAFIEGMEEFTNGVQVIFQLDDVNNGILDTAMEGNINVAALFDLSGGTGVLPEEWPKAKKCYCGYAGGLSPENLTEQLELISKAVTDRLTWIDTETGVRTRCVPDDKFDLEKVKRFLEIAKDWVV